MGMKGKYRFKSFINNKNLSILLNFESRKEKLIASFTSKKEKTNDFRLAINFVKYPLMTFKVILEYT